MLRLSLPKARVFPRMADGNRDFRHLRLMLPLPFNEFPFQSVSCFFEAHLWEIYIFFYQNRLFR